MAGDVPPPRAKIAADQRDRFEKIFDVFQKLHGKKPHCYVRAPGRINLIGEHIDYCGYAVLPMAIEQAVVIAVGVNKANHTIQMTNTNASFAPYSCETTEVQIDAQHPQWYHYVLCGFRGVVEHAHLTHPDDLVGLELVVDSTLPMSAGLSSSSALVCAAALATMQAYKLQLNKRELAEICQHCERYIGTEGGGMDQAIAFLADAGTAKLVEFDPIRTQDVRLPENAAFVVSNCCVEKHKATSSEYNTRVAECRLACQILAKAKGLDWCLYQRLGDLQSKLGANFDEMLTLVRHTLHEQPYSKAEVCSVLQVSPEELNKISLSEKSRTVEMFKLHQRAVHVYSEAGRVWKFKAICDKQPPDALKQLGQLMTDSHASCRDLYECSCTELDQLVTLACASGSLGSRLTGAGWGGCAISLIQSSQVDSFIQKVAQGYYGNNERLKSCLPTALFATLPGYGATVFE